VRCPFVVKKTRPRRRVVTGARACFWSDHFLVGKDQSSTTAGLIRSYRPPERSTISYFRAA
jgi:hypothetical protein